MIDYSSIDSIKFTLNNYGLAMTKSRGQNFLIDKKIRTQIATLIINEMKILQSKEAKENINEIWEIGPGFGSLTSLLLFGDFPVRCFELDKGFIKILKNEFSSNKNFIIEEGDANINMFKHTFAPYVLCGNLPYNVGTIIITEIFKTYSFRPKTLIFMFQKEVAGRLCSTFGSSEWGGLSALRSFSYSAKKVFDVPRSAFYPSPKVNSSIVVLKALDNQLSKEELHKVSKTLKILFAHKRKTIYNNLLFEYEATKVKEIFDKAGIEPNKRAEELTLENILSIAREIEYFS